MINYHTSQGLAFITSSLPAVRSAAAINAAAAPVLNQNSLLNKEYSESWER